jgi:pyridoxamine 5'-phosphate oxidase
MNNPLFASAPGFEQPLAVLKHCHDKIRGQLRTMRKLLLHLPVHGADEEARQAAAAVLKYFDQSAPLHHADEEENLLPMLRQTARGDDAVVLAETLPGILAEHARMDACWQRIDPELRGIAGGEACVLSEIHVAEFADLYTAHMEKEEAVIAPMAKRLFSASEMQQLGNAMRERRGIGNLPPSAGTE